MIWIIAGWLGQGCFFLRFAVQWWRSEQAGESVAPRSFWWLSLAGAALVGLYTLHLREPVLAGGFAANAWIYARNLGLERRRNGRGPSWWELAPVLALLLGSWWIGMREQAAEPVARAWWAVSVLGQLCWSGRFVVQWIASERSGRSHFPVAFWWISLLGNLLLLGYAAHLADPLLILAFAPGPLVQIRNLQLSRERATGEERERRRLAMQA